MRKRLLSLLVIFAFIGLLIAIRTIIYQIDPDRCWNCGRCTWHCPVNAIQFSPDLGHFYIDPDLCNGCGNCVQYCPYGAIYSVTSNDDDNIITPELKLKCSPNPASGYTDFSITFPAKAQQAELIMFNAKGNEIFKRTLGAAETKFRWNGTDFSGKKLASGIYLARLVCEDRQVVNKITLVQK